MLTLDAKVEDFDASDFIALGDIFGQTAHRAEKVGLVAVVDGERILKLLSSTGERLDPGEGARSAPIAALAVKHDAAWAVRLDHRAVAIFLDRFATRLERKDGFVQQTLKFAATLRELSNEGLVETYPRDSRALFVPTAQLVFRVLDAACPVGKTVLVGAFEGGEVVTSIALHRAEAGFDRIVGPAELRREMGLVSGDWTKDCRGLARAVELGVGPVAFGCFAEARTFRRLMASTAPGAWASAVASRDVIFHPVAPALAVPLGVDVGRAALVMARDFAARLGVGGWFSGDAFGSSLHRVREVAARSDVERLLSLFGQFGGSELLSVLRALVGPSDEPEEAKEP